MKADIVQVNSLKSKVIPGVFESDIPCGTCGGKHFERWEDINMKGIIFSDYKCLSCGDHVYLQIKNTVIQDNSRKISHNLV